MFWDIRRLSLQRLKLWKKRWSIIVSDGVLLYISQKSALSLFLTVLLWMDDPEFGMTVSMIEASWYVDANSGFL